MKKHASVFTIVKNEKIMLPLWLKYYSQHFLADDIYVLDHQSDDGSTANLPCHKEIVFSDYAFDHLWLNGVVRKYQKQLLEKYKYVLFVECDEFIYHPDGLGCYINKFQDSMIRCNGFELQHIKDKEDDIDVSKPILSQRSYWHFNIEYCKVLLSSVPLQWSLGFHLCQYDVPLDPLFYLIHLHKFDYNIALQKNIDRAKMKWPDYDLQNGHGFQNRILGEEFDKWFHDYKGFGGISLIPDYIKKSNAL